MVQPYSYQVNVQSPFEAALSGFKIGATIADVAAQRQAQERDLARQKMLQEQVQALIKNPNPNVRDFTNVAMLLPKAEADSMRANWEALSKERQENELRFGGQVMSAFSTNQPQIGVQMLRQRAAAERNAGREAQASAYETWAQMAEINPANAQKTIGIMMAGVPGGDKVLQSSIAALKGPADVAAAEAAALQKTFEARNTPQRLALENAQTGAQIRNLDSTIADRANRLVLDRDKLKLDRDELQSKVEMKLYELNQKAGQLDPSATKLVNESAIAAVGSEQSAARMLDLANRLDQLGGGYGALSNVNAWIRNATGNQDAWTQARQEYVRLRNTQAIKALPPGPATDRDIELTLKGFPSDNADAGTISSFLRGMAKLSQYEAVAEGAKAEWVNSVGSLGRSTRDIEIGGIRVPRNTTYVDFARQFMERRAQDLAAAQAGRAVSGRGYMRWANPQTGVAPVVTPPAESIPAPQIPFPGAQ